MIKKTCAIRAGMAPRVGGGIFFHKAKHCGGVSVNLYTKSLHQGGKSLQFACRRKQRRRLVKDAAQDC